MDIKLLVVIGVLAGLGAFLGELILQSAWGAALGGASGAVVAHFIRR